MEKRKYTIDDYLKDKESIEDKIKQEQKKLFEVTNNIDSLKLELEDLTNNFLFKQSDLQAKVEFKNI